METAHRLRPACIRITRTFHFEMAHALYGHDGPCKNIHGHSYELSVTLKGRPLSEAGHPKDGMVMDFSELKAIVERAILSKMDHALVLNKNQAPPVEDHAARFLEFQPTCENLLLYFACLLEKELPPPVRLHSLHLKETRNSACAWYAEDNE
jgi:6-pyruvoyltetrahydropterin/6-carboxytetrahydropterin synthase